MVYVRIIFSSIFNFVFNHVTLLFCVSCRQIFFLLVLMYILLPLYLLIKAVRLQLLLTFCHVSYIHKTSGWSSVDSNFMCSTISVYKPLYVVFFKTRVINPIGIGVQVNFLHFFKCFLTLFLIFSLLHYN
jgi:hypothetical protein